MLYLSESTAYPYKEFLSDSLQHLCVAFWCLAIPSCEGDIGPSFHECWVWYCGLYFLNVSHLPATLKRLRALVPVGSCP